MSYSAYDYHSSNPSPSLYNTPTLLWSTNHTVLTTSPTTTENTEFTPKVSSFEPHLHSPHLCSQETKKAHARFKSANDCLHKPKQERYQHFLSPPLPSKISLIQPKDNLTAEYKSPFQFQAILHSPTAITKKEDEKPITYLNRGQSYLLDLTSSTEQRGILTSTISIEFHEPIHRKAAESYWRFWIGEQMTTEARAIGLEESQTTGIFNVRYPSFDQISFDWYGCFGANIYIRFYCLSTDFSRIKGVKGIPMRIMVETTARYDQIPENLSLFTGTFHHKSKEKYEYVERCFCQIKLFRDKGAERKNKDDTKQINKQMEKVMALTLGRPEQHPLWPVLNQPYKPVTVLSETPSTFDIDPPSQPSSPPTDNHSQKRKHETDPTLNEFKRIKTTKLICLYVWSKRQFSSTSPEKVYLQSVKTEELKLRLSAIFSLDPLRITEIVWRKTKPDDGDMLVLIDDTFMLEHMPNEENVTVDWEIKFDNHIRLILEFNNSQ
ncbi:hypothetical protein G6F29_010915 [Rhizopus arrhizus]|nr:hypothetical protein G6F33_008790 [Rhizopus arrhizus]KAG0976275.1 hypothetical protein G6F29_010915 [Rhizopus arrhizus]KAG1089901.1 hypothetical protein G6F39_010806 [Rhizopus arrhizus]